MPITYKQLMELAPWEEPSSDVAAETMKRIRARERARLRAKIALHGALAVGALASIVPTVVYAIRDMTASGLSDYLSLIVSDSSYLASHWTDLALSIASSWPIMTTMASIALVMIIASSLRRFAADLSALSAFRLIYR